MHAMAQLTLKRKKTPGNGSIRGKREGRTKIETINPTTGILSFNLLQTFASGSMNT